MEIGYTQRHAQLSRFDHDARIQGTIQSQIPTRMPAKIPHVGGQSQVRRQSHENADWAGNVPQSNARKQYKQNAQVGSIQATEHGIVPNEDAELNEHNFNTRKHFENDIRYNGLNQQTPLSNAYQCGPGEDHSASQWKTTYQTDVENRGGTQKDQYLAGKGTNRGGKKMIKPEYMRGREFRAGFGQQQQQQHSGTGGSMYQNSKGNYRQTTSVRGGGGSLLAGIGSNILSEVRR